MDLSSPVTTLPGIGQAVTKKLNKLGISSVFDLLLHLPFRYEDRSQISPIGSVQPGETVTVLGTVSSIKNVFTKNRKFIQQAEISDSSGTLPIVWFHQPYLVRSLRTGQSLALYGKVDTFNHKKTLISPDYEIGNSHIHTCCVVPIYPETAGISSKYLRTKIYNLLGSLPDEIYPAPPNLPSWKTSLREVHFPTHNPQLTTHNYKQRLAFDELFLLHLKSLLHRQSWNHVKLSHPFALDKTSVHKFISTLPFTLTHSQQSAVKDILADLADVKPMNRLLEGDVGSGKTVIAATAAYITYLNNFQTLILAPTQILAQQHFQTLTSLFQPSGVNLTLITAGHKAIKPSNHVIVGTHALLSKQLKFEKVGLVVIDEQHRFGVAQRALATSLGHSPHILTMTATPIPRSIALTLHGDLDLSVLSDMPPGRLPTKTWVVPETKRASAYGWIASQNTQAFVICPFIEPSETLSSVKAATLELENIKKLFPDFKIGLLHGQLKSKAKDEVLNRFRVGDYQILVCTPIVEVGIDVPAAGIMVIEDADRFGLAQLHQLRGRVGRGDRQSYCLLFGPPTSRLKAMETHHSGLELAEIDLRLRGPGQLYGTAQSGLSDLKIASYTDTDLIAWAKSAALDLLPQLNKYPQLQKLIQVDKISLIQPN